MRRDLTEQAKMHLYMYMYMFMYMYMDVCTLMCVSMRVSNK